MTKKEEVENAILARKIGLQLAKTDKRSLDEKLEDLETEMEDFKCRRADEEVVKQIADAKTEGDASMFEDPPEKKPFSWEDLGCE